MNIGQAEYYRVLFNNIVLQEVFIFLIKKLRSSSHVKVTLQILYYKRFDIELFIKFTCYFQQRFLFSGNDILLNDFTLTFLKRLIGACVHPA